MLECNRLIHKRLTVLARVVSLLLPVFCLVVLLSQVVFAKNTYVINDGDRVLVHTTYTKDPAQVLTEAGFELGKDDTYVTQPGIGMSEITVQRQQTVTVLCGSAKHTLTTYGQSVGSLLEDFDLLPGKNDSVSVSLDAKTEDGMTVVITRCVTMEQTYSEALPFDTLYILDTSLTGGEQKLLLDGALGQVLKVDRVSYRAGEEISRENLSRNVVTEPVSRIVAVGSLEGIDPADVFVPGTSDGDSHHTMPGNGTLYIGDGLIVTPDGQILTYTDSLQVVATAYHNSDPGCTIYTAIGTLCRVGAIAVDPKVIPYGTRMYIVTNDGEYIYGIAVAEDCGGSIKGNRVDLYFDTTDECWEFGIRDAMVYFLG